LHKLSNGSRSVRGYYADSPILSRYFLQSMWLTRQYGSVATDSYDGDRPMRRAVALAAIVKASGLSVRALPVVTATLKP
jgi:hypothetical protein